MLRALISSLSSLRTVDRIVQTAKRLMRQSAVIAVASALFLMAVAFLLVLAYQALMAVYDLTPMASAGILSGALILSAMLALAVLPLMEPKQDHRPMLSLAQNDAADAINGALRSSMRQVGPITLLAAAFAAGLLASRR